MSEGRTVIDGRYEVGAVLGSGANAVVYLAKHLLMKRKVALKIVRSESSEDQLAALLNEAAMIGNLTHTNIVTVYDVGHLQDGRPYIAMEYVQGKTLEDIKPFGVAMPIDVVLSTFLQVSRGLAHAHRHGIVHRDIKPANILIEARSTGQSRAKLADFGIAKLIEGNGERRRTGTPRYWSPEQAAGKATSPQSDIYSLGVIMYELLAGNYAFGGLTTAELTEQHLKQTPPPLALGNRLGLEEDLKKLIERCMDKDPAKRPEDASKIVLELERLISASQPQLLFLDSDTLDEAVHTIHSTSSSRSSYHLVQHQPSSKLPLIIATSIAVLATITLGIVALSIGGQPVDSTAQTVPVQPPLPEVEILHFMGPNQPDQASIEDLAEPEIKTAGDAKGPRKAPALLPMEPATEPYVVTKASAGSPKTASQTRPTQRKTEPAAVPKVWRGTADRKDWTLHWTKTGPVGAQATMTLKQSMNTVTKQMVGKHTTLPGGGVLLSLEERAAKSGEGWTLRLNIQGTKATGALKTQGRQRTIKAASDQAQQLTLE